MEILYFNDYAEIGEYMYEKANIGFNITATLFLEDTIGLMRDLMSYENIEIGGIDVAQMEYNGYSKEYYVTLSEDLVLDIEPAWNTRRNCYLYAEPDIMLIDGEANSAIIKDVPKDKCTEIYIGAQTKDNSDECTFGETCNVKDNMAKTVREDKNDLFDVIFENATIIKDDEDEPIGISFKVQDILNYLFE